MGWLTRQEDYDMRGLCGLFMMLAVAAAAHADHEFYLSPSGNDAWTGTVAEANAAGSDGPWMTLEHARDAVRQLRAEGKLERRVIINLRAGEYHPANNQPLELTAEDSGKPGAPVLWRSMPGEHAAITGGAGIKNWEVQGEVWSAAVPELADSESGAFGSLWINGERRTVARTPNVGEFFNAHGGADPTLKVDLSTSRSYANHAFVYNGTDIAPWPDMADALVTVLHAWEVSFHRIATINEAQHTVQLTNDAYWPFGQWEKEQRYYIQNTREALDQPGEWYLDRKEERLYYVPMPGETPQTVEAVAPAARQLLLINGNPETGAFAEFIQFEDISFSYTDWPIGPLGHSDPQAANSVRAAVEWKFARYCEMNRCEIAHTGGYAAWMDAGCQQNRLYRNHFHDLGAGGVRIGGATEPVGKMEKKDVVSSRNIVENNWIHDGGHVFPGGVGVWIGHANYITISHNEISDFFYTGISNGWVWGYGENPAHHNVMEYNHIHDIGKGLLSDMGGIYNLGIQPGTIMRNNLIHDIRSHQYGGWGLYTDEGSTEMLLENNVVYNTTSAGFHQHYGENNRIRNNIFAFSDGDQLMATRIEDHRSFVFERNIVLSTNGRMVSEPWLKVDSWCDYNLYWDTKGNPITFSGLSLGAWMATGHDLHSISADPKFKDAEHYDFTLAPDSPALALGFEPIDVSRVGLYGDAAWRDAPRKE